MRLELEAVFADGESFIVALLLRLRSLIRLAFGLRHRQSLPSLHYLCQWTCL